MSDRVQELMVFVRAAEGGSFSKAARELGLSQPSVSRIVSELEARLGVTLLLRTTRQITLTDAGTVFLERARQILAEIEDAEDAARGIDSLRGTIRIAMPVIYGTREVVPRIAQFLLQHPLLQVEMTVADERQDLVAEGADVAIRLGPLDDSAFGARRLETMERMLVAAPGYLEARGTPRTPADLALHDCIFGPRMFGRETWTFERSGAVTSVDVRGRVRTNSGPGLLGCLVDGLGIATASRAMVSTELKSGRLVRVLPGWKMDPVDVHAVFPGGPRPSAKVKAFVDFLAAALSSMRR
jgi:DNA-binding transcriptional LysR family regulator